MASPDPSPRTGWTAPITGQEVSRKAYLWPLCDLYGERGDNMLANKALRVKEV